LQGVLRGKKGQSERFFRSLDDTFVGEQKKPRQLHSLGAFLLLTSAGGGIPMLDYSTNRLSSQEKSHEAPSIEEVSPSSSSREEGQGAPLYLTTVDNLTSDISEGTGQRVQVTGKGEEGRRLNDVIADSLEGILERSGDGGVCEEFVEEFGYINVNELAERIRNCGC